MYSNLKVSPAYDDRATAGTAAPQQVGTAAYIWDRLSMTSSRVLRLCEIAHEANVRLFGEAPESSPPVPTDPRGKPSQFGQVIDELDILNARIETLEAQLDALTRRL